MGKQKVFELALKIAVVIPKYGLVGGAESVASELCERLAARGVGVVYVSHKLGEIARIADRVTVLRDGERVATRPVQSDARGRGGTDPDTMARLMVGREVLSLFAERHRPRAAGKQANCR